MSLVKTKNVLAVLTDHFSVRNFLYSPFLEQNFAKENIKITFLLNNPSIHQKQISHLKNIELQALKTSPAGLQERIKQKIIKLIYQTASYRFNKINHSQTLKVKEKVPKEFIISQYDQFSFLEKFPRSESLWLYRFFYQLYNLPLFSQKAAKQVIQSCQPNLILATDPQTTLSRPYFLEAKKRKIKTLCYVNSWDYLTTDGPVLKTIDYFAVWGEQMKKELKSWHKIKKPIEIVGPLHFDYSFQSKYLWPKEKLTSLFNIPYQAKIITYGVCGPRIGQHEPAMAQELAKIIPPEARLIIRGHPADQTIPERFKKVKKLKNVSLIMGRHFDQKEKTSIDDRALLFSLLKHSQVVLCGPTTLTLDALRFDRPVINIAFELEKIPETASISQKFKYDHFAPLLNYQAIYLAKNLFELKQFLFQALSQPTKKLEGVKKLKQDYLEPLDGLASKRLFNLIKKIIYEQTP